MLERKYAFKGKLVGESLQGSIDKDTHREDKALAIQVIRQEDSFIEGYRAYIFEKEFDQMMTLLGEKNIPYVAGVAECNQLLDYDVIRIDWNGNIRVQYRVDSEDNVLYITSNCNSNCIMCPEPEAIRRKPYLTDLEGLKEYISMIPTDTKHLTITGGEPTLIKERFLELLLCCKEKLPETTFLMLTNGRSFSVKSYAQSFLQVIPDFISVAIPLYSHKAKLHDEITRVPGSFIQAKKGIENIGHQVEVEVRVVIMKDNYKQLPLIAKMIAEQLPFVRRVSFMGLELMSNAYINRERVWIDYVETTPYLEKAIITLVRNGIESHIYNYPLCAIPERLWSVSRRSITDYKVRYKPECDTCMVKSYCGGFFFSTINYDRVSVKPIERESK